jgi:extradiol dioxygenase family protein
MQPILHLSIPVRDLSEATQFYVDTLGCDAARAGEGYQDVWFYGMQLTLHNRPEEAAGGHPGSVRHFGVTLGREEFEAITSRVAAQGVAWESPISTDNEGTPTEQTKTKIADPSGNVIELKTYRDVSAALEISPYSYPESIEHGN